MSRLNQLQAAKTDFWNREYELDQLTWSSPLTFHSNAFFKRILSPYQDSIWIDVYTKGMFLPNPFHYRERIRVYQMTVEEAEELEFWGLNRETYLIRYFHFKTGEELIYFIVPALYGLKSHFETHYPEVTNQLYENEELMLGLHLWLFGLLQHHHHQQALYALYGETLPLEGDYATFRERLMAGHVSVEVKIKNLQTQREIKERVQVDLREITVGEEQRYRSLQYAATPLILFGKEN